MLVRQTQARLTTRLSEEQLLLLLQKKLLGDLWNGNLHDLITSPLRKSCSHGKSQTTEVNGTPFHSTQSSILEPKRFEPEWLEPENVYDQFSNHHEPQLRMDQLDSAIAFKMKKKYFHNLLDGPFGVVPEESSSFEIRGTGKSMICFCVLLVKVWITSIIYATTSGAEAQTICSLVLCRTRR